MSARVNEPFSGPDFSAPIAIESLLSGCPRAEVKGVFFEPIAARTRRVGKAVGRDRYVTFRGYPLTEWIEFLPAAARVLYPHEPVREGIRRLGQGAYDGFLQSTAGSVLMSFAGPHLDLAVPLVPRAYVLLASHGRVTLESHEPGRAVYAYRGLWDFIDAWHVGVLEGCLRAFRPTGRLRCRMYSQCDGDLEATWS